MPHPTDASIGLELSFTAIQAKLKALKAALNDKQLELYNESMQASKTAFCQRHPSMSLDLRKTLDELFV
jgi:hypothetical protein